MKDDKIEVIETNDILIFKEEVNDLLKQGWQISSTSCGFVNSAEYDFCGSFQAILVLKTLY